MNPIVVIFIIVVALGAFSQVSLKKGMLFSGSTDVNSNLFTRPRTFFVSLGLILYAVAMLLWLAILPQLELSFVYPCSGWVTFL